MYYGQYELDKWLNDNIFKNKKRGFYVEAGAHAGVLESSCKFFEDELKWRGINIEAVPRFYNELIRNRPRAINIGCALSDKEEKRMFTHVIHPTLHYDFGNGSLEHKQFHIDELVNMGCVFEKFEVQCYPFYEIFKIYKSYIDLFVLDIEGTELEALDGIFPIKKRYYPKVFCIEHTLCGFEPLKEKMILNGYELFDVYMNNSIFVIKR